MQYCGVANVNIYKWTSVNNMFTTAGFLNFFLLIRK